MPRCPWCWTNTAHIFDMDESEVMVTRGTNRSGESEYYINRRSVRLRDVNELFNGHRLGPGGLLHYRTGAHR